MKKSAGYAKEIARANNAIKRRRREIFVLLPPSVMDFANYLLFAINDFFLLHVNSNSKILTKWSDKKVSSKQQTPRARPCKYAGQLGYGMGWPYFLQEIPLIETWEPGT